ncbi:RING finger protein [Metarhizium rileyi]|uniref:RING-type E3 ubiquitin transferase n=1 Tax=Metarhizium rileyi (strain RCEF 4871) TaxID=1649241 RepID=A0A167F932_METRR|nr:RING finger protein [Metarhizium rileyi RCEF 4871]TWU74706.1 E3 ubiquitin-protein ligase hrd1 [Metarhizium rileyi]
MVDDGSKELSITWHQSSYEHRKLRPGRIPKLRPSQKDNGVIGANRIFQHQIFLFRDSSDAQDAFGVVSTALAGAVVISAFQQRANFYSAMVYLAQSNFCLLALVNFSLLLYSSFIYGLTKLCYGTLRAVEVEQLTERAWFAITETCLAMTIFREEIGAWFLVMFTALVTGKVWGWIGDGRVEFLEQQPPANPRLFHVRLSVSLAISLIYDIWILKYTVSTVIQQARPNMMVMFLFEFAVLATCSLRTAARYVLSIAEQNIVKAQTRQRLTERRQEIRLQREALIRDREQAAASEQEGQEPPSQDPLPIEDDIDEMDIEVPGWASKGEWVLWLDLVTDMIKLGIYLAFFFMLLRFYGLPIHIMRDLFMTSRDFIKRLNALLRYRRAIQEMNRYPDATLDELSQENTCIICREEMRPWDPVNHPRAIDRVRPKKLPCGHVLHLGCLKSWLERQQVCPTCRSPVTLDRGQGGQNRAVGLRIQIGGAPQGAGVQPQAGGNNNGPAGQQGLNDNQVPPGRPRGPRVFNLGPFRLGFGANGQQARELVQQFGIAPGQGNNVDHGHAPSQTQAQHPAGDNLQQIGSLLNQTNQIVQREVQSLQMAQQELQVAHLLMTELQRLRQRRQQQPQDHQPFTSRGRNNAPVPGLVAQNQNQNMYIAPQSNHNQLYSANAIPSYPSRMGSPFIGRHGTSANSAAIPAGSPDLPEGVALPPGWSLIPLQRLDGTQPLAHQQSHTAATSVNGETPAQRQSANHTTEAPSTADANGDEYSSPNDPNTTAFRSPVGGIAVGECTTTDSQTTRSTPVVAPSPLIPSWGGPAQLFNNRSRAEAIENAARSANPLVDAASSKNEDRGEEIKHTAETGSAGEEVHGHESRTETSANSGDQGRAKAATVEEAGEGEVD